MLLSVGFLYIHVTIIIILYKTINELQTSKSK